MKNKKNISKLIVQITEGDFSKAKQTVGIICEDKLRSKIKTISSKGK